MSMMSPDDSATGTAEQNPNNPNVKTNFPESESPSFSLNQQSTTNANQTTTDPGAIGGIPSARLPPVYNYNTFGSSMAPPPIPNVPGYPQQAYPQQAFPQQAFPQQAYHQMNAQQAYPQVPPHQMPPHQMQQMPPHLQLIGNPNDNMPTTPAFPTSLNPSSFPTTRDEKTFHPTHIWEDHTEDLIKVFQIDKESAAETGGRISTTERCVFLGGTIFFGFFTAFSIYQHFSNGGMVRDRWGQLRPREFFPSGFHIILMGFMTLLYIQLLCCESRVRSARVSAVHIGVYKHGVRHIQGPYDKGCCAFFLTNVLTFGKCCGLYGKAKPNSSGDNADDADKDNLEKSQCVVSDLPFLVLGGVEIESHGGQDPAETGKPRVGKGSVVRLKFCFGGLANGMNSGEAGAGGGAGTTDAPSITIHGIIDAEGFKEMVEYMIRGQGIANI